MKKWGILILVTAMLFSGCRTGGSAAVQKRKVACKGSFASTNYTLRPPPELEHGTVWERGRALAVYSQDLHRCLESTDGLLKWTLWDLQCERNRNTVLENSFIPGRLLPRGRCREEKPTL